MQQATGTSLTSQPSTTLLLLEKNSTIEKETARRHGVGHHEKLTLLLLRFQEGAVQNILCGIVVQFKAVENLHSAPSLHAENAAIYSRQRRGRSTLCLDARIMIRYVHYHQRMQLKCQPAAWRHISPFFTLSSSSSPLSFYNLTVPLIFQHIEPLTSTPLVRLRGSREPLHDSRISDCGNDNRSHCLSANNFLDPTRLSLKSVTYNAQQPGERRRFCRWMSIFW
jgi:hypothetical protein